MLINKIKEELNCHINDFHEFLSSQKVTSLLYKESDLLSVMKSFGSVEIKEASFDIIFKPFKTQQAQFAETTEKASNKIPTRYKIYGA